MRSTQNGRTVCAAGVNDNLKREHASQRTPAFPRPANAGKLVGGGARIAALVCVVAAMLAGGCVPGIKRFSEQILWPEKQAASGNRTPGPYASRSGYPSQGNQAASPGRYNPGPVLDESGGEFDRPATAGKSAPSWEDQKVRVAALELAKSMPSTAKIKVCFDARHDEWWVILYDRLGGEIDIKQFVWDREKDNLEPFLVVRRIPVGKLEEHANRVEKDRACETFDPPRATRSR